mgnify:CR=1 FL=1
MGPVDCLGGPRKVSRTLSAAPGCLVSDALAIARRRLAEAQARRRATWERIQAEEPSLGELLTETRQRFGKGTRMQGLRFHSEQDIREHTALLGELYGEPESD